MASEVKECMFCLEPYFGRKKAKTMWYAELYPCECRFPSHWQCIIKWQVHCNDRLQCPICRIYTVEPPIRIEELPEPHQVFYPELNDKKIGFCIYVTFLIFLVFVLVEWLRLTM